MAQNPNTQQLYSELIERMKQGVEMHEQLADYYGFLNLPGYQKCHEYQMLCELLTYRKAKDSYMKEYNQLVPLYGMMYNLTNMGNNGMNSNNPNNGNQNMNSDMSGRYNYNQVIPQNWYKYTRYDVDANTKRNAVRDGFKKWLDYEKDTKQFLTDMAKKLEQADDRESARKLDYLIDHVEKEVETAEEKMMALENSGYDMNYILQQQDHLKAKYADKIRKLNMKDSQFRRRGMGNYTNYNNNFADDDDDDDFTYHYSYGMPRKYPEYY